MLTEVLCSETVRLVDGLKGLCHGNQIECVPGRPPTKAEVTYQPNCELLGVSGGKGRRKMKKHSR